MKFKYANLYYKVGGESVVYGLFANKRKAMESAKETLATDPLKKGWNYVQTVNRQTGEVIDDCFNWEVA